MKSIVAPTLLAVLIGWANPVWAHSPVPGIEGFYVGLWHPLTVPGQILLLSVVGLLLGFRGVKLARPAFIAFTVSLAIGAAFGRSLPAEAIAGWVPLAAVLLTAPALIFRAGEVVAIVVAALGGLVVGLGSLPEPGPIGAVAITLAGSLAAIPFMMLGMAAAAEAVRARLPPSWTGTVAGVTGAWILAIATLMLALEMRI
ncbi:MAG: hypothetical protein JJU27_18680 [Gammaproteobacteria bacterium]|nr:hypothetical protein [Gammaproteobacteria bacterium]